MALVNINSASAEELQLIPGIGEKKANALIKHRDHYGKVTKQAFSLMLMGEVRDDVWGKLDFIVQPPKGQGYTSLSQISQSSSMKEKSLLDLEAEIEDAKKSIEEMLSKTGRFGKFNFQIVSNTLYGEK